MSVLLFTKIMSALILICFLFGLTNSAEINVTVQPIRVYCSSDVCQKSPLREYSTQLQPNNYRTHNNLTISSHGLNPARLANEVFYSPCYTNGTSPINNYTDMLSAQLQTITSHLNMALPTSCLDLKTKNSSAQTGYHFILINGSMSLVYCDMDGLNCGGAGGWTRVAFINTSDPLTDCPPSLQKYLYPNLDHPICGRVQSNIATCNGVFFSSYGINYTTVCGRIRGYQFNSNDGFYPHVGVGSADINDIYLDGISITYDYPRQHIWSYAGGLEQRREHGSINVQCPCNQGQIQSPPAFVGNDYYCESALPLGSW